MLGRVDEELVGYGLWGMSTRDGWCETTPVSPPYRPLREVVFKRVGYEVKDAGSRRDG